MASNRGPATASAPGPGLAGQSLPADGAPAQRGGPYRWQNPEEDREDRRHIIQNSELPATLPPWACLCSLLP